MALAALAGGALTVPGAAQSPATQSMTEDVYPRDITPPAGTQYPCALTALPGALPGIPEADRAYINRTYARILRATQAKLVLLKALGEGRDLPQIAEGRQASARLISAWGRMQARYLAWSSETSNSIYHHLCALDLF